MISRGATAAAALLVLAGLPILSACGTEAGPGSAPSPQAPTKHTPSPAATTPTPPPDECPATGASISVSPVEAAVGHRAVVLTLTNCGRRPLTVDGYPLVTVLDAARKRLKVTVAHDSSYMAIDRGPQRIRLTPRQKVLAVVAWSGTVTYGDRMRGTYLAVARAKGEKAVIWPVDADLGTTTKVELTAWNRKL